MHAHLRVQNRGVQWEYLKNTSDKSVFENYLLYLCTVA